LYFLQSMVLSSNKPLIGTNMFLVNLGDGSKINIEYNLKKSEEELKKDRETRIKQMLENLGRSELYQPSTGPNTNPTLLKKKSNVIVSETYNPTDKDKLKLGNNSQFNRPKKINNIMERPKLNKVNGIIDRK
jgi:hypothetical protein